MMKKKAKTTKLINKYFQAIAKGEMRKAKRIYFLLLRKSLNGKKTQAVE
tara:strand:- start:547 stop:693 length:147 start_codon:yes stop_codon:yes gene_type:complete